MIPSLTHFEQKSFGEFMRGNEYDIDRFWLDRKSSQGQRVHHEGAGISRPRKSVPNPTDVEGAKPSLSHNNGAEGRHPLSELAPPGNRHARLPLSSEFSCPVDPLVIKLLHAQRGEWPAQSTSSSTPRRANTRERGRLQHANPNRSLLSAIWKPQNPREQILALLAIGVGLALLYGLVLAIPHIVTAYFSPFRNL